MQQLPLTSPIRSNPAPLVRAILETHGWHEDRGLPYRHRWSLPGTAWCARVTHEYTTVYRLDQNTARTMQRYPTREVGRIRGVIATLSQQKG